MSYRKIGGLRFFRVGRLQVSWCVLRRYRVPTMRELEKAIDELAGLKGPQ